MNLAPAESPHRKLVSVRWVSGIKSLDSSQTHEVAMVDGWPVVVEKGRFRRGRTVLYFAIDCVLPLEDKRYEPYRFSHFFIRLHEEEGFAVQTVKHEGHVSQGMVFAIDDSFPEINRIRTELRQKNTPFEAESILMNLDLKDTFKIRKWRTFYPRDGGINLGQPPRFLPENRSERAQDIAELYGTYGNTEFQITEILDGIPMIFYDVAYHKGFEDFHSQLPGVIMDDEAENGVRQRPTYGVSIGGHDYEKTESSIGWTAVREQGILGDFLHTDGMGLAGVLCGEGISGNPLMIQGHRFYIYAACDDKFKVWETTDGGEWPGLLELLERVPKFATRVRLSAFAKDLDELLKKAQGASCVSNETRQKYPSVKRKGLAFRTLDGSFSFRVIANDWLLDETERLPKAGGHRIAIRPGPNDCVD